MKLFAVMGIFSAAIVIAASAQSPLSSEKSPQDVVERFCKMDLEGKRLTSEGGNEISKLLFSPTRWSQSGEIAIVGDYVVHDPVMLRNRAQFTVDYHVWGQVDSSLRFARLVGATADTPVRTREYMNVVLANRHNELGPNGQMVVVNGPPEWRIEAIPSAPHVDLNTAIRFVREMGGKSTDDATKDNADKTVATLQRLLTGVPGRDVANLRPTPTEVVERFCRMDVDGKQLTPDGWREVSALFVQSGTPRKEKIVVVKNYAVSNASISQENSASVVVEYLYLGALDSRTALLEQGPLSNSKLRANYTLILVNKNSGVKDSGVSPDDANRKLESRLEWKIEGTPPEPHVTLDTAIELVKRLRDDASNDIVKANAEKTIAVLTRLR